MRRQRCTAIAVADGAQCGRSAIKGKLLCHIHQGKALGQLPGVPFTAKPRPVESPEDIVRRFMSDPDASIRRHGVELWMKHFEPRQKSDDSPHEWLRYAADIQMDALREFLVAIKVIRESVLTYIRAGGTMRPDQHPDYIPPDIAALPEATVGPLVTELVKPVDEQIADEAVDDDFEVVSDDE
jgi:hypothetical protein